MRRLFVVTAASQAQKVVNPIPFLLSDDTSHVRIVNDDVR